MIRRGPQFLDEDGASLPATIVGITDPEPVAISSDGPPLPGGRVLRDP